MTSRLPLIIITGPTASGKSALAVRLAKDLNGEILNIDSVQIYKEFNIGSGKSSLEEQGGVPHHLLDCRDPRVDINVAEFLTEAEPALAGIHARCARPILVGGTGLYVKALIHGLAELPAPNPALRAELEFLTNEQLSEKLRGLDPSLTERIAMNDRSRLVRGIEIALQSERASSIHDSHQFSKVLRPSIIICLQWPREKLGKRINARAASMVEQGLVNETNAIIERHGSELQGLEALGYSQVMQLLKGELEPEQLTEEIATRTRQFSKRQLTFWRNQPLKLGWRVRPKEGEGVELGTTSAVKRSQGLIKDGRVFEWGYPELLGKLREYRETQGVEIWHVMAERLQGGALT